MTRTKRIKVGGITLHTHPHSTPCSRLHIILDLHTHLHSMPCACLHIHKAVGNQKFRKKYHCMADLHPCIHVARMPPLSFHLRAICIHVSRQHFKISWLVLIQDAFLRQLVQNSPQLLRGTKGRCGRCKYAHVASVRRLQKEAIMRIMRSRERRVQETPQLISGQHSRRRGLQMIL